MNKKGAKGGGSSLNPNPKRWKQQRDPPLLLRDTPPLLFPPFWIEAGARRRFASLEDPSGRGGESSTSGEIPRRM